MLDDESITSTDGAVPRVMLVPVEGAVPVVRAKSDVVVLSGNGDGIVDAAAAGLIDGYELIRYSADVDDEAIDGASALIVTDTNRDRARRWNSSQDRTGFTETGGSGAGTTAPDAADSRLPVFSTSDPATMTTAHQRGPVTAVASSYGEPDGYRPEDRAAMAIDGDRSTAWRTGDRFFVRGESIELHTDRGIDHITFVQPQLAGRGRRITGIELRVSGRSPQADRARRLVARQGSANQPAPHRRPDDDHGGDHRHGDTHRRRRTGDGRRRLRRDRRRARPDGRGGRRHRRICSSGSTSERRRSPSPSCSPAGAPTPRIATDPIRNDRWCASSRCRRRSPSTRRSRPGSRHGSPTPCSTTCSASTHPWRLGTSSALPRRVGWQPSTATRRRRG